MVHRTTEELLAAVDEVRGSPADDGVLAMIVRRPEIGRREVLEAGELDPVAGLVGDIWRTRGSSRTDDGGAHPGMQVTLMNVRAADLVAVNPERRPLAGDQLYVDLDLGTDNLPPGTKLAVGSAVLEITAEPHRGCAKFAERFGRDAARFVSSPVGLELNLRGVNARVLDGGLICLGDAIRKVSDRRQVERRRRGVDVAVRVVPGAVAQGVGWRGEGGGREPTPRDAAPRS